MFSYNYDSRLRDVFRYYNNHMEPKQTGKNNNNNNKLQKKN